MRGRESRLSRARRAVAAGALLYAVATSGLVVPGAVSGPAWADSDAAASTISTRDAAPAAPRAGTWLWPLPLPDLVIAPFVAPASAYAAGHRGVDFAASAGEQLVAPAGGTITFSGVVVDRPVVSLQLDDGALLSVEPVQGAGPVGSRVERGGRLGTVAQGGHCDGRCLHVGVRIDGAYVSPMMFFADVAPAVLLPLR